MDANTLHDIESKPGYLDWALDMMLAHPEDYGMEDEAETGFLSTYPDECYADLDLEDRKTLASMFEA